MNKNSEVREVLVTIKCNRTRMVGEKGAENILKEIIVENFPNLLNNINHIFYINTLFYFTYSKRFPEESVIFKLVSQFKDVKMNIYKIHTLG